MPLSAAGLCDARNHHTGQHRCVPTQVAAAGWDNAGVPVRQHLRASEAGLHRRGNKVCGGSGVICDHGTGAYALFYHVKAQHNRAACANSIARAGVITSFARPRTPSVPKKVVQSPFYFTMHNSPQAYTPAFSSESEVISAATYLLHS